MYESPTDGGVTLRTLVIVLVILRRCVFLVATGAVDGIDVFEVNVGPAIGGVTERAVAAVVIGWQHVAVTVQTGRRATVVETSIAPRPGVVTVFTTAGIVRRLYFICVTGRAGG